MKQSMWWSHAKVSFLVAVFGLVLAGCADNTENASPEAAVEVAGGAETTDSATKEVDPNSMQAIQDAIREREKLPGRQHYETACVVCHDGTVKKAPHKDMIGLMTPEAILGTLTNGIMQNEAAGLSTQQKVEVAEYLAGVPLGSDIADIPMCTKAQKFDAAQGQLASNWGISDTNNRYIPTDTAGLSAAQLTQLKPKWAVKFPSANRVRSQPALAGGLVFVGSHGGQVYGLDAESGCQVWSFQASGEVRTGIVVAPFEQDAASTTLYFGDVLGNAYAVDAATGEQQWRQRVDDHPNATITASPALFENTLFIPVSSLEVSLAIDPHYECCTFRGSILAVNAKTGDTKWRTYTIFEEPTQQKLNAVETPMMGPSGAVVWNTPAIDAKRRQIYFGTGENMSSPATKTSDALFALNLDSGEVNWVFQATENDAWNVACDTDTPQSCPEESGPDFDFGGPTILLNSETHGDLVVAGQKSGFVHALNPDSGALVWQTQVGRGGIQGGIHFGMAAADGVIYVPISDMADGRSYEFADSPGMHAVDVNDGKILWSTIHEDKCNGRAFCHPGISQVPTVIGDTVIAGAMDGRIRAYARSDGAVLWSMDTTQSFPTVTGDATRGGSFGGAAGPVSQHGMLIFSSGYGIYNHMPGNLLMVMEAANN